MRFLVGIERTYEINAKSKEEIEALTESEIATKGKKIRDNILILYEPRQRLPKGLRKALQKS